MRESWGSSDVGDTRAERGSQNAPAACPIGDQGARIEELRSTCAEFAIIATRNRRLDRSAAAAIGNQIVQEEYSMRKNVGSQCAVGIRSNCYGHCCIVSEAANKREELMKHLFTTVPVTAAFALPLAAVAQERYPALNPDQLSSEQKAYVENLQKPPRNNTTALKNPPFKVYMRSPELASKLEAVSDYVRWGTGLQPRLTELAIMITARQWSSQWIWRGHYRAAVRGGLDPSVGADIAAGKRPEKMKEDETILYNYATEMYRDKAVSDATFAAAVKQFGEKGLIDLVATMGYYDTVAMTLISAKAVAPKEDDVPQLAALPR